MLSILMISSIYPLPNNNNKGTSVCHFFSIDWVKMGYKVRVVHVQAVYPLPFYWLARLGGNKIASKTGAIVYPKRLEQDEFYVMDSVPVKRIPLFKPIPHGRFNHNSVKKAVRHIVNDASSNSFTPDVIIGHFPNPQIEMLSMLKKEFPLSRTCIVMHGDIEIMTKVYKDKLSALMKDIDMWGFRSKNIKEHFERVVGVARNSFICYSGIPKEYIAEANRHDFQRPLRDFVYVGALIDRKYPEKVLDALNDVYRTKAFHLTYIGEGQNASLIRNKINRYGVQEQVSLLGRIPRDRIIEEYDKAECMVMISRGEAYGLVYLEAMARGCITIASKGEGFDGVIVDGINGFLCKAGDGKELASIIRRINSMTKEDRESISENAIATARRLTDEKAARMYINDVIARM